MGAMGCPRPNHIWCNLHLLHLLVSISRRQHTKRCLAYIVFSCISARRRRRMGYSPYRGTGWALGRAPPGHGQATYNQQPYYANQQPYQSGPQPPPTYGASQDYYSRQNDVELQSPPAAYGGQNSYAPPPGPPPAKNDGIIR